LIFKDFFYCPTQLPSQTLQSTWFS
jgi:hypothetical protein